MDTFRYKGPVINRSLVSFRLIFKAAIATILLYIILVATTAVAIYKHDVDSAWTRAWCSLFPYPAAIVNKQVIPVSRFRREVRAREFYSVTHNLKSDHKETEQFVMQQLVDHTLYAQALSKAHLTVSQADVNKQLDSIEQQIGGEAKLSKFLQDNYGDNLSLADFQTTLQESLQQAAIQHQLLTQVTVRHILIATPQNATQPQVDAAQQKAKDVRAKITGPDQFAAVAKQYSDDAASRDNGGLIGTTMRGATEPVYEKDIEATIFNLKVGDISDPVLSSVGWHILMVDKRTGSIDKNLEQYTADLHSSAHIATFLGQ